jgi:flagellar FliJ protein
MKRSERMEPVQQVLEGTEQARARELTEGQKRLAAAAPKLTELSAYHGEYLRAYRQRAEAGTGITRLRDFQAFLARLEQAMSQQEKVVATAREAVTAQRRNWQGAARQVKAVESVVDRWRRDEVKAGERRDQKETDERAQQSAFRGRGPTEAR